MARWPWQAGRRLGFGCLGVLGTRAAMLLLLLLGTDAVVPAWRSLWFAASGVVVDGVVVRQRESLEGDWTGGAERAPGSGPALGSARRLVRAVVEFRDGETVRQLEGRAAPAEIYPTGTTVAVVYPPGHPERAQLRPELPDVWLQAAWLLVGTFLIGWAIYWWWLLARRPRRVRVVKASE